MAYNNNRGGYSANNAPRNPRYNQNSDIVKKMEPVHLDGEKSYVDIAEDIIQNKIRRNKKSNRLELTTSKIRNILAMTTEIYDDVIHFPEEILSKELVERIQYLRLRVAYEAGREDIVKDFVEQSDLMNQIKWIGNSKSRFLLYVKYMEALVAFHRFYGGND